MAKPARLIAIGDVHGCIHALDALVDAIGPTAGDTLVFLGDLIDRGRDSRAVLERVIELQRRCRVVLIEGNHEEMLLAARENEKALRYWENCGGIATLASYRFCGTLKDIPPAHWELLGRARPYYETDEFIFTHASYLPDLPMPEQPDYQLRWALLDVAEGRPHNSGKPVVVGHWEQPDSEVLDLGFAICIDTACWRYGWLTALDLPSKQIWQASRWGMLREADEAPQRGRLPQLAGAV
ncbi:MAG: metallophosphoesterase family protein [Pirellulales bacterium]